MTSLTQNSPTADSIDEHINICKCYNCGKVFKKPSKLAAHKQRKTPCLIREVAPVDRANVNRCIFCNKIFSNKSHLIRHLKTCKIRNGGMDILDEKIRYEQKIRILEEKNLLRDEREKQMQEQITRLQNEIHGIKSVPAANTTNNSTNNIIFCDYDKPDVSGLVFTQDNLISVSNLMHRFVELIYFNKEFPQNCTLYPPNIKENRLLVHTADGWQSMIGDELKDVFIRIFNCVYLIVHDKINGGNIYKTDAEFMKLYPVAQNIIQSFNGRGDHARMCGDNIMEIAIKNKALAKEILARSGVI